jgi:hypothetical protein
MSLEIKNLETQLWNIIYLETIYLELKFIGLYYFKNNLDNFEFFEFFCPKNAECPFLKFHLHHHQSFQ